MDAQFKVLEGKYLSVDEWINEQEKKLDQIMLILKKMETNTGKEKDFRAPAGDGNQSQARNLNFNPKLEFPKFDGNNTRIWIKKACKYFELCKIPDDQWVDIASLHMVDKAENWVTSYLPYRKYVAWHEFIIDLSSRFRDEKGFQNNHYLLDSYILDSFIGGLKPSVRLFVKAFKPTGIAQAIEYARLKEEALEVEGSKFSKSSYHSSQKPWMEGQKNYLSNFGKPPLLPTPNVKSATRQKPDLYGQKAPNRSYKYIPADVRAEKIAKGLCYYCDKPFEKGHKCSFKEPQLFTVEIPAEWACQEEQKEDKNVDLDSEVDSTFKGDNSDAYLGKLIQGSYALDLNLLKPFYGVLPEAIHIPAWFQGKPSTTRPTPEAILDRRIMKVQNKAEVQFLVHWKGFSHWEATSEPADDFQATYPHFPLTS
ncbi:unnamed protein product [Cuscuta campestris]|uniref:Chromo domain-containing protein n=1 Tax=Cuscuta campestris TaxID=132261 RepID=A0A484KT39_9ASTE|nr:unnamed protein product [Cuscuta campestris]